ncbi:MAG: hypothetical protein IJN64_02320 [Lachnospiraceae bacterium]|nr:hypothetical protein [Lachnospiraceae bacterium]
MIIAINYADNGFKKAQRLNSKTAKKWGADKVIEYGPADIDEKFREKNKEILDAKRGNGYYLWKPYFLNKAYKELGEDDYLIYTDSGAIYVNKIQYLIECMEKEQVDLMIFSLEKDMLEKKYTKRDTFILMGCDLEEFTDTPQSIGGYVVMKKSPFVEKFLAQDLEYAQDPRIITELDNTQGVTNYEEFIAHRHDQSVWSLMSKKYKLKRFRDPSQFGMINFYESEVEERSTFPQVIDSHRMNVGSILELRWKRSVLGKGMTKIVNKFKGLRMEGLNNK